MKIRERAMEAASATADSFPALEAQLKQVLDRFRRGYFHQKEKKQELRQVLGLTSDGSIPKRWQKKGRKLSLKDILDILHRVYIH